MAKRFNVSYTITATTSGERAFFDEEEDGAIEQFQRMADSHPDYLVRNWAMRALILDGRAGIEIVADNVEEDNYVF